MENRGTYEKGEGEKRAGLASLNQPNTKKGLTWEVLRGF